MLNLNLNLVLLSLELSDVFLKLFIQKLLLEKQLLIIDKHLLELEPIKFPFLLLYIELLLSVIVLGLHFSLFFLPSFIYHLKLFFEIRDNVIFIFKLLKEFCLEGVIPLIQLLLLICEQSDLLGVSSIILLDLVHFLNIALKRLLRFFIQDLNILCFKMLFLTLHFFLILLRFLLKYNDLTLKLDCLLFFF
jgi:hypothetical protein